LSCLTATMPGLRRSAMIYVQGIGCVWEEKRGEADRWIIVFYIAHL